MNKTVKIILISGICLLLAALGIASAFSNRISMNPNGTVGNSAGNLNNDGLFCEYDGRVYFSNAADRGCLYSMNPDETDVKLLNKMKVRNILAGGKYLFFYQSGSAADSGPGQIEGVRSFCRSDLKGDSIVSLTRDTVITGQLVDNYLYLLTDDKSGTYEASFYKLKIDKSDQVDLASYQINPACAENGIIYYNGTRDDHYLYTLNTANDVSSELWRGNLWYPALDGGYIYYMDVANNYRLCRYSLNMNEIQVLTNDRVDCFNVGNGYVYYQKNDSASPQLRCMRTDGSDNHMVAEGNFTRINMTSRYVYFQSFGNELTTYHSPLGSSTYNTFAPAAD
ncbi:MAG: DUF5050 domain-containing protein [Butyrivibrio sp.]|nr:DUF5050 domain-containing protein [Acetatifactor muris]MCM1559981.1 DUF5050 domain-containing protein [Butyrivibrio sp.]